MTMPPNYDPSQCKILLVDDTPANIDVLSKTLRPEGYKLAIAQSGDKALKVADHFQPDLILLDIMMPPGIDGIETCHQLKAKATTQAIPVIFITAKTEIDDITKGFQAGGVDYILKPFHREEICARIKTQLQLQFTLKQLIKENQEKNKLIGTTAHDLRNPLSGILGFCDLLLDQNEAISAQERQEYLTIIRSHCAAVLATTNRLLDVTAISHGTITLNYQIGSLPRLINNRLRLFYFKAEKKNITLETHFMEIPDLYLDHQRISHVLDTLLDNAIKFSPPVSHVQIHLTQENRMVQVSIHNSGSMISTQEQTRLFQYFKASAYSSAEQAYGLGLAIAKQVIDTHRGTLTVNSDAHGVTFSFTLPLDHPATLLPHSEN